MTDIDSTSDARVANNMMRHQYRVLSDDEKETMLWIKDQGLTMLEYIEANVPSGREAAIAKTRIEEAVMWAVRGLTG